MTASDNARIEAARPYWQGEDERPDAEVVAFVDAWRDNPTLTYVQAIAMFDAGKAFIEAGRDQASSELELWKQRALGLGYKEG